MKAVAYDAGYEARIEGQPKTANAYSSDAAGQLSAWAKGWNDADDHSREAYELADEMENS